MSSPYIGCNFDPYLQILSTALNMRSALHCFLFPFYRIFSRVYGLEAFTNIEKS